MGVLIWYQGMSLSELCIGTSVYTLIIGIYMNLEILRWLTLIWKVRFYVSRFQNVQLL